MRTRNDKLKLTLKHGRLTPMFSWIIST